MSNRLLVDLLNAETGQRGFLLTGQPTYLQPYQLGAGAAPGDLAALAALIGSDGRFTGELAAVRALSAEKRSELARTVALAQSGHHAQAVAVVNTNVGQHVMDAIRARIAVIGRRARELSLPARRAADSAEIRAFIFDALVIALALALALRSRAGSRRADAARDRALVELEGEARLERALREVAEGAAGQLGERELAALVAARLGELLDASTSAVIRADEESLRIIGYCGPIPYPERLGWDEASSSAQAVRSGMLARLEDYGPGTGAVAKFIAAQGVRCGISVPVRMAGGVWGCLTVTTTREGGFAAGHERWLERFASLTSAALASARAQALLRAEARLEHALRDVATTSASAALDERALGQLVAERVAELLGVAESSLWRFDEGSMTKLGYHGSAEMPDRVAFGEPGVAEEVRVTGAPACLEDYDVLRDGVAARFARASGVRCAVGVPVFVEGAVWGAVVAATTEATVSPELEGVLERFAELASVALANSQARARLRFRVALEETLREVAVASAAGELDEWALAALVADRVSGLLDSPSTSVVRFAGGRMTLLGSGGPAGLPPGSRIEEHSITGRVARSAQTVTLSDYTHSVGAEFQELARTTGGQSAVAVPVFVGGELWGSLGALLHEQSVPASAVELLERFAQQISAALANTQAQARLREEARLESALREVAAASAGGEFDAHDLFTLVATHIAQLLDADAALVVRLRGESGQVVGWHGAGTVPGELPLGHSAAASRAISTGQAARVEDYQELDDHPGSFLTAAAVGYRTAVAAPAYLHGTPWGYIAVANSEPYSFAPGAEAVLERFAALVALALAQADTLAALQRQASTDGLTGLLNHLAFQERLQHEFARARRHHRPLSLVVFDIDSFKLVNDLHGHSAGDRVLEAVGRVLAREQRAGDIPARVGGDEFAVIAPETSAEEALTLAERLRAAAAAALDALALPATISAGVTDLTHAQTMHDLFHLADSALYYAKHHGRDRAERYTPGAEDDHAAQNAHRRLAAQTGLAALVRAVDAKDSHTQRHSERVARICAQLATRLGWPSERRARLREAALLHDVGKIGVPDAILSKPGRLTSEELELVKAHSHLGAQIAAGVLDVEQVSWVRGHHERPDGRGYPNALKAPNIPDGALIIATADAYDTITSGRPYKAALSPQDAIAEMRRSAGTQFDAELIQVLEQCALHSNDANADRRQPPSSRAKIASQVARQTTRPTSRRPDLTLIRATQPVDASPADAQQ